MKISRRQLRQLINEAMRPLSDKEIDNKIHDAAIALLDDNPDFEYDDCYDEAAEQLGHQEWNEARKAEHMQQFRASYEKEKAKPDIAITDPRHGMHDLYKARVDREDREYAAAMRRY